MFYLQQIHQLLLLSRLSQFVSSVSHLVLKYFPPAAELSRLPVDALTVVVLFSKHLLSHLKIYIIYAMWKQSQVTEEVDLDALYELYVIELTSEQRFTWTSRSSQTWLACISFSAASCLFSFRRMLVGSRYDSSSATLNFSSIQSSSSSASLRNSCSTKHQDDSLSNDWVKQKYNQIFD